MIINRFIIFFLDPDNDLIISKIKFQTYKIPQKKLAKRYTIYILYELKITSSKNYTLHHSHYTTGLPQLNKKYIPKHDPRQHV